MSSGHAYLQRSALCGNVMKSCGMYVIDEFFLWCSLCTDCTGQGMSLSWILW